mmetsp:Transcript_23307/g.28642  ORF Transcript_23307/g.28642 Transcript_23307/m.28642 type:complete len:506 (+) Transcript_23307:289-1806(+)
MWQSLTRSTPSSSQTLSGQSSVGQTNNESYLEHDEKDVNVDIDATRAENLSEGNPVLKVQATKEEGQEVADEEHHLHVDVDDSPNLFDEVSLSTKDSICNISLTDHIFDFQYKGEEILEDRKSVSCCDKSHDSRSYEEKNSSHDDDEDIKSDKTNLDEISLRQDETMSYSSFQRIEKRAALREKVSRDRLMLASKLSILKTTTQSQDAKDKCDEFDEANFENEQKVSDEDVPIFDQDVMKEEQNVADGGDLDEKMYLDLGKELLQNTNDDMYRSSSHQLQVDGNTTFLSRIRSMVKTIFYASVILSIAFVVCAFDSLYEKNLIEEEEDVEPESHNDELITKVLSLLLVQFKMNKIRDDFDQVDFNNRVSYEKSYLAIFCILLIIAFTSALSSIVLLVTKSKIEPLDDEEQYNRQISTTPRSNLKREISSLDKKNIFASTVTSPLVKKDGTLVDVKRTMRFSPEVQRFSSDPKMHARKVEKNRSHQGSKSTLFSPEPKMKPIKEEK